MLAAVAVGAAAVALGLALLTRATALADAARSYMGSYVPVVTREVTTDSAAARSVPTTTLGKRLVDGIRSRSAQLERLISARQAARQHSAHDSANTAVTVALVVLVVLTALTLALGGFLGWLLVGRERARERAAFLAEAGAQLDRGSTGDDVLRTFATLAVERGNDYCVAEELAAAARGSLVARVVLARRGRGWRREELQEMSGLGTRLDAPELRRLAPAAGRRAALNEAMLRQDLGGRFITIIYALLSVGAGEAQVTVACSGHPPALFVSDAGEPAMLGAHGDLLGIWPDLRLEQVDVRLGAGESLVLYTDGVTEQGPGAANSPERVIRDLGTEPSANALADALHDAAERSSPVARDDLAIVALRFLASGPGRRGARVHTDSVTGRRTSLTAGRGSA